ncbi:MAG: GGDEF domain-containing protein [Chitinophagaceae bacterium]|nr:GGDEF domain-containing protein [Oligoflexus sp.]
MQIKPKPTPTLKARPGSTEEVFAKTLAGAEALWRETQIESLIEKTMTLLKHNFAITALAMLKLPNLRLSAECCAVVIEGSDTQLFFDEKRQKFILERLLPTLGSPEYVEGIHSLQVETHTINFALLGDRTEDAYLLLWIDGEHPTESTDVAIDFLVRQLQTTYRWFSRMSETQTLLHLDDLTGLYNHRYLDLTLDRETKRSLRYGSSFSLLFIDLDNFKPVNDTYGHLAGSQVLREVAAIIRATVRDVDLVFRFGGDEFVVILIEADSAAGLRTATRIQERIEQSKFVVAKDALAQVTSSIGVAAFPEHTDEKERLIAIADEGMYESKRRGKNQCVLAKVPESYKNPLENKDLKAWPHR